MLILTGNTLTGKFLRNRIHFQIFSRFAAYYTIFIYEKNHHNLFKSIFVNCIHYTGSSRYTSQINERKKVQQLISEYCLIIKF